MIRGIDRRALAFEARADLEQCLEQPPQNSGCPEVGAQWLAKPETARARSKRARWSP
jgi:hypothetical protein